MRNWERPMAVVDAFVANEFVSACGEKNQVYKFKCTADAGELYYYPQGDGTIDGIYKGSGKAQEIGSYHPCGKEHEASVTDDFYDGYVYTRRYEGIPLLGGHWVEKRTPVIVWRGENGRNGHATTNLNMSEWTTARS